MEGEKKHSFGPQKQCLRGNNVNGLFRQTKLSMLFPIAIFVPILKNVGQEL